MFAPSLLNSGLSNLAALRNMPNVGGGPTFGSNPPTRLPFSPSPGGPGGIWGGNPPVAGPYPISSLPAPGQPPVATPARPITGFPGTSPYPVGTIPPAPVSPVMGPQPGFPGQPGGGMPAPIANPISPVNGFQNNGLQNLRALLAMRGMGMTA